MNKFMITLLGICLICTMSGTLLGNWFLGIVPLFIAIIPAAYFGSNTKI